MLSSMTGTVQPPTSRSRRAARSKNAGGCSSLSPSRTFERCGSGPYPYSPPQDHNRSTSPLSHSVISSSSSSRSVTKSTQLRPRTWLIWSGSIPMSVAIHPLPLLHILSLPPLRLRLYHSTPTLKIVPTLALPHSQWSSSQPRQPRLLVLNLQPGLSRRPTIQSRLQSSNAPRIEYFVTQDQ